MSATRREFLERAAFAAAIAGFGPGVMSAFSQSNRPYRDLAIRCASWIDTSTQIKPSGLAWPADPLKPAAVGLDYYNGSPGVVCFFANLWHATRDQKWRERAEKGAAYLAAEVERLGDAVNAGLYTGLAGIGATYMTLDATGFGKQWEAKARQAARDLAAKKKIIDDGVEWAPSNDIISGTAGTGLFLLAVARKWNDAEAADLAARAGRRLIKAGVPAEGGLMWFPGSVAGANYPNFSHGTAGVAYFLATLYLHTKDQVFLEAALAGEKYLNAVATKRDGGRAIFHVTGGGENRFYLSWCHGPVGTARLYQQLAVATSDARFLGVIKELNTWITNSGAPEQQSAGYWNNISQCCGNVGIGQYWIDLSRQMIDGGGPGVAALRERVVTNTMSRATDDEKGLRWVQAENRVSPDNLVAQTGFMQGAAGVGTFFLQLDALSRGEKWIAPWPDTPW